MQFSEKGLDLLETIHAEVREVIGPEIPLPSTIWPYIGRKA